MTYGQSVTLTATVSAVPSVGGTPTGTVTFMDGSTTLGPATLANGSASLSLTSLPAGMDVLTASYGGGPIFAASNSGAQAATLVTVAGGGQLSSTSLAAYGMAIDSSGNLYVACPTAEKVFEVSPAGVVTRWPVRAPAGYSGDNGAATAAETQRAGRRRGGQQRKRVYRRHGQPAGPQGHKIHGQDQHHCRQRHGGLQQRQ